MGSQSLELLMFCNDKLNGIQNSRALDGTPPMVEVPLSSCCRASNWCSETAPPEVEAEEDPDPRWCLLPEEDEEEPEPEDA